MKVDQFQYERGNINFSDAHNVESTVETTSYIRKSSGRSFPYGVPAKTIVAPIMHVKAVTAHIEGLPTGGNVRIIVSSRDELSDSSYVILENLDIGGARIKLKKPFRLEYTYHNGLYDANNDEIRVSAVSKNLDDVIEIISEKIEILYDLYVNDVSMELTEDALELRKKLKGYLGDSLCLR